MPVEITAARLTGAVARRGAGRRGGSGGQRATLFCLQQSVCVHNTSPVSFAHCNLIKADDCA